MSFPLQEYMASLDNACLPRILQVCSGVYFQGSVYEISGNEVSFSTGDVVKVTDMELSSICCHDVDNDETFELPVDHTGLMKVIPEETPYSTVEELVKLRPLGLNSCLPVTFASHSKLTLDGVALGAGATLTVVSLLEDEKSCRCRVRLGPDQPPAEVTVPLSTRGEFYVHQGEERFVPRDIATSPHLRSQRFCFENATLGNHALILSPVYQIRGVMNLRKNLLRFPSSLAVDVVDITDTCQDLSFLTPLTLPEVHSQPDQAFPMTMEVLEGPETSALLKCSWLAQLQKGTTLILHQRSTSSMTVLSSSTGRKSRQYFLVSERYGGRFRKRPRRFDSTYELYEASTQIPGLKLSVVSNHEEVEEEGLPGLALGEQLEVIGCQKQVQLPCGQAETLVCRRLRDSDDDEDEDPDGEGVREDHVYLPLYMQGQFVELLRDNKKYTLEVLSNKVLLDVKVVTRDPELENDPLVGFSCLRIEGTTLEATIQASFPDTPELCFLIPVHRLSVTLFRSQQPLPWSSNQSPKCSVEPVIEVTDQFLREFRNENAPLANPPPRPPKRNLSVPQAAKSKGSNNQTLWNRRSSSPLPPTPNVRHEPPPPPPARKFPTTIHTSQRSYTSNPYVGMSSQVKGPVEKSEDVYEQTEELSEMLKKAKETIVYY
ncbi:protein THEMIS2 isoform X2 [Stigmatopora argus]